MTKKFQLVVVVMVLVLASIACVNDDDNVVIEVDRLEYLVTPTPLSFTVGDSDADDIVEAVLEGRLEVDEGLNLIEKINCKLGFSTCLSATSVFTPTLDLWGGD